MTKSEWRKIYRAKRGELPLEVLDEYSLRIANQLLSLPIWEADLFSLFLSIKGLKEVNTEYILHILQGRDKQISLSQSNLKTYEMKHVLLTEHTPIKINSWGIPEPVSGQAIQPQEIDVVFVPLLAYDKKGNRLGYGKGFYDRFLSQCKPDSLKIGLSFFAPEEEIPSAVNDVPLDFCVTPFRVYKF